MTQRLRDGLGSTYQMEGDLLLAGAIASPSVIRSVFSYVQQDDENLIPTLTVRETLQYAASLRLPFWMSAHQKSQAAESILLKLGLRDCANTLVGGMTKSGISKGEKRRVTIGVQLLTEPHVLILDEPTSGLDTFTATSIINILRSLTMEGKTIILTIHQPRADHIRDDDQILLLARAGYPVYGGSAQAMLPHFSHLGYDCLRTTSPTDFALDLVTVDLQSAARESETSEKVQSLAVAWKAQEMPEGNFSDDDRTRRIQTPAELRSYERTPASLRTALPILLKRSSVSFRRTPGVLDARIFQVIGFAVIMTLFWAPLKSDYEDVQSRVGYVQQQMGKSTSDPEFETNEQKLMHLPAQDCTLSACSRMWQFTQPSAM